VAEEVAHRGRNKPTVVGFAFGFGSSAMHGTPTTG